MNDPPWPPRAGAPTAPGTKTRRQLSARWRQSAHRPVSAPLFGHDVARARKDALPARPEERVVAPRSDGRTPTGDRADQHAGQQGGTDEHTGSQGSFWVDMLAKVLDGIGDGKGGPAAGGRRNERGLAALVASGEERAHHLLRFRRYSFTTRAASSAFCAPAPPR